MAEMTFMSKWWLANLDCFTQNRMTVFYLGVLLQNLISTLKIARVEKGILSMSLKNQIIIKDYVYSGNMISIVE